MLLNCFKWKQVAPWIEIGNVNLILIWPHFQFQQKNAKEPFCQKHCFWSPKNALLLYRDRICWQFKYRFLKSWKICHQYIVIQFVVVVVVSVEKK